MTWVEKPHDQKCDHKDADALVLSSLVQCHHVFVLD